MTRYALQTGVDLIEGEDTLRLLSRYPARLIELSTALLPLLAPWRNGGAVEAREAAVCGLRKEQVERLLAHLVERGFVVVSAVRRPPHPQDRPSVSVVVVVRERARQLACCLRSLCALDWPADKLEVIVVDDHSRDRTALVAERFAKSCRREPGRPSFEVLVLPTHSGIAEARNAGVRAARGEIIAFTDSDCAVDPGWLSASVPALVGAVGVVGAVGGSVRGLERRTLLQRYEDVFSPLHMGDVPRRAGKGAPVPYLPTCNFVGRREAIISAGCFDPELQVGEDVDICRRLEKAGWKLAYDPAGIVYHDHRDRVRSFLRRRADYGRSESVLRRRWGREPAPAAIWVARGMGLALLLVIGMADWRISLAVLAATILLGAAVRGIARMVLWLRSGRRIPLQMVLAAQFREAVAVVWGFGMWFFRYWSIPFMVLGAFWPRLLILMVVVLAVTAGTEWVRRRPKLDPATTALLYFADLGAYQVGARVGQARAVTSRLRHVCLRFGRGLSRDAHLATTLAFRRTRSPQNSATLLEVSRRSMKP